MIPSSLFQFAAEHPIVGQLIGASIIVIIQILALITLAAGIVEETWFRGPLLRHLREWTSLSSRIISLAVSTALGTIIFCAFVDCFLFAIVHPQGIEGVPVLMGAAAGFVFMREYRDSLIAPMTAHAISNAITLMIVLLMFG